MGSNERVVTSGYDNKVNVWDLASGELAASLPVDVTPSCVTLTPDGAVYVGGPDGYIVKLMLS